MNAKVKAWLWDKFLAVLTVFAIMFALILLIFIADQAKQVAPSISAESSKHSYSININF